MGKKNAGKRVSARPWGILFLMLALFAAGLFAAQGEPAETSKPDTGISASLKPPPGGSSNGLSVSTAGALEIAPSTALPETGKAKTEQKAPPLQGDMRPKDPLSAQTQPLRGTASKVITSGKTLPGGKRIALTFDAGWLFADTEGILQELDKHQVKATFFVRGYWAREHPELARQILRRGHQLENHSLTHGHLVNMSEGEVRTELSRSGAIIREITGVQPKLFRPPYGEYDNRLLRLVGEEGYAHTIMWTVDTHDWAETMNGQKVTREYLVKRVLSKASDGGIVLMHVGGTYTVKALPEILAGLRAAGYQMVLVSEML